MLPCHSPLNTEAGWQENLVSIIKDFLLFLLVNIFPDALLCSWGRGSFIQPLVHPPLLLLMFIVNNVYFLMQKMECCRNGLETLTSLAPPVSLAQSQLFCLHCPPSCHSLLSRHRWLEVLRIPGCTSSNIEIVSDQFTSQTDQGSSCLIPDRSYVSHAGIRRTRKPAAHHNPLIHYVWLDCGFVFHSAFLLPSRANFMYLSQAHSYPCVTLVPYAVILTLSYLQNWMT